VCNLCGQTFLLAAHLAQHMRTTHTLAPPPPTTSGVDISRFDTQHQPHAQPQEPKEADTAETRPALAKMAMLPTPMEPSLNMAMYNQPLQQHFHYLKEALSRRLPVDNNNQDKLNHSDSENQKPSENTENRVREVPFNLQDFILKKVVQEVTSSPYAQHIGGGKMPLNHDKNVLNTSIYSQNGGENYQKVPLSENGSPAGVVNDRGGFPAKSDGKRHICGLCGASFTFQTNLTRHQRKLHGKPYVRRGSTGIPTTIMPPMPETDKVKTP
jgi:uncharacterized Zn-finger protein